MIVMAAVSSVAILPRNNMGHFNMLSFQHKISLTIKIEWRCHLLRFMMRCHKDQKIIFILKPTYPGILIQLKHQKDYTAWCCYNAVSFLTIIHKRHLHSSPVRARYEVSFVDAASDWYSTTFPIIIYVISYNIRLHYNGTQLYYFLWVQKFKIKHKRQTNNVWISKEIDKSFANWVTRTT